MTVFIPPSFKFKGDQNKSISLKAQALQFYNYVIRQAEQGGVSFINRSTVLADGSVISVVSKKENNFSQRTGVITIITSSGTIKIDMPKLYVSFYNGSEGLRRKYYKENINSGYATEASSVGRYGGFSFDADFVQESLYYSNGYWTDFDKKAFRYNNIASGSQEIYINGNIITVTGIPSNYVKPIYTVRDEVIYGVYFSYLVNAVVKRIGQATSGYSIQFSSATTLFTIPSSLQESFYFPRNSFDKEGLTVWLNKDKLLSFLPDFSNYYITTVPSTIHPSFSPHDSSDNQREFGLVHPSEKGFCGFRASLWIQETSTPPLGGGAIIDFEKSPFAHFYELQIAYPTNKTSITVTVKNSAVLPDLTFSYTSAPGQDGGTQAGRVEGAFPLAYCAETNTCYYNLVIAFQSSPGITAPWTYQNQLIKSKNGSKEILHNREVTISSGAFGGSNFTSPVSSWTNWQTDRFLQGYSVASTKDIFCLNSSTVVSPPWTAGTIPMSQKAVFLLQSKTTGAIESTWDYNLSFKPAQGLTVSN